MQNNRLTRERHAACDRLIRNIKPRLEFGPPCGLARAGLLAARKSD
jgi:hypothetical protein